MPDKRKCIVCGGELSQRSLKGDSTCVGGNGKAGCGLVYQGLAPGIGEHERPLLEIANEAWQASCTTSGIQDMLDLP